MAQVNGEMPSSAFINHLTSYPVVSDSISTFKSHPIGQKTLNISATSYDKFGKPVITYFRVPYSKFSPYIIPYAQKADKIGDSTLSTIDSKFPTIKKPTGELYEEGKGYVFLPLKLSLDGKDYVIKIFDTEKKNVGAEGIVGYGKAALATGLVISSDTLSWISSFLSKKKTEVKEVASDKMSN